MVLNHVLALPASASIQSLARAWFPDATWIERSAEKQSSVDKQSSVSKQSDDVPRLLRLAPGAALSGPHALTGGRLGALDIPARLTVAHVAVREEQGAGAPVSGASDIVLRWMIAAARSARGAVVPSGATSAVVPGVEHSVNRRLFSAHALAPATALALVSTLLPQAVVQESGTEVDDRSRDRTAGDGGPVPYEIIAETRHDGVVTVLFSRPAELPPALSGIPWRESGPFCYSVQWSAGPGLENWQTAPSTFPVAVRGRISPTINRVVSVLRQAIEGTVLDDDGFIRTADAGP